MDRECRRTGAVAGQDKALLACEHRSAKEAEALFPQAVDNASRQAAKSLELRERTGLARLLTKQNRRDETRPMLSPIHGWFTEGFDTADLKDAKVLLDELIGSNHALPEMRS